MAADGFCFIDCVGAVLNVRGAAAGGVKDWRAKLVGVQARRSKLRDKHSAVDVSVPAAVAVNLACTEHHNHAVKIEVSIESEPAGDEQRSLTRRIARSEREVAVNKREHTVRIAGANTRSAGESGCAAVEISSLVDRCLLHSFAAIHEESRARNIFKK